MERNLIEINFLYELLKILHDVRSDFLDNTFKCDPPKLSLAAVKLYEDK